MTDKELPTIRQILTLADTIGDKPLDSETLDEWFRETCRINRQRDIREVERVGQAGAGRKEPR